MNELIPALATLVAVMIMLMIGLVYAIIKAGRMKKYIEYTKQIEAYAKFVEKYEKVEI